MTHPLTTDRKTPWPPVVAILAFIGTLYFVGPPRGVFVAAIVWLGTLLVCCRIQWGRWLP